MSACLVVFSHEVCYIVIVPCETLQSTTNIIMNFNSTAMGSNATYQCRNGSSDVYTTQCTSDGVWEPNPNSTLNCTLPGKIIVYILLFYIVYVTYMSHTQCNQLAPIVCCKAR